MGTKLEEKEFVKLQGDIYRAKNFIREYLIKNSYIEVDCPILSKRAIPESSIELYQTERRCFDKKDKYYLLPSPELYLKRLLSLYPNTSMFQFQKCFRNSEQTSAIHCLEFTMLEYYKQGFDEEEQIYFSLAMLKELFDKFKSIYNFKTFSIYTMRDLVEKVAGLNLDKLQEKEKLQEAIESLGIKLYDKNESWADSFNRLFVDRIEPFVAEMKEPVVIKDYPRQIECLARDEGDYKRRWELYYKGVELANCYFEMNDEASIKKLFLREEELKKKIDPKFRVDKKLKAFKLGKLSGVALGFDRLMMLLLGKKSIRDVILFYDDIND